ncbi:MULTISPECIES: DUF979 domain-containing protein [Clostridium]|uniref:DUF979 domain-containing protein n=1 Tax=Clostridium cadaveris TaxID=1529 RepID=A0A1I2JY08_9CLOT|nr:DUF979 domain-containing protein [Clostridium cadaveris]MDU4952202.1 DUF979 domain-containing protein [Clostridium sp.]MDM8312674.1 DUF979 domain-containing protein [Clostridium cadaveris]MDY4950774.1 DUF979 domain-containing protein [Clostridium cadaveris]NME64591.1 DUF979 domain-containing protein [Clostridium cadaveris]NWK10689.1 DUF979 domain-containing protein [Clostridium cadaveris]
MFSYFGQLSLSNKLLEILYIIMGFIALYTGIKNAKDKGNPHRLGTAVFWCSLAIIFIIGKPISTIVVDKVNVGKMIIGGLVVIMAAPAMLNKVSKGTWNVPTAEESKQNYNKIGMKIFIPALAIGCCALAFALFTKISALVGVGVGVLVSVVLMMIFSKDNTPKVFIDDSRRLLDTVGAFSMLPMLLGALGAIFTSAGVGQVIADLVGKVVPSGNMTVGIIIYAIAMALFTMIMGNAFAAITVITVGIGAPFVLALGADPVIVGSLALTCGYCGTLCTPMAANFNLTSVAILEMKDDYGVIKKQLLPAICILIFQIVYMLIAA